MKQILLSPYVRLCRESILSGPLEIHDRVIYDYELIVLENGNFLLIEDGKNYYCESGDVILLRPGHTHSFHISENEEISQPHVHFDPIYDPHRMNIPISFLPLSAMTEKQRKQILPDNLIPKFVPTVFKPRDLWRIGVSLHKLIIAYTRRKPYYQLESQAILLELLINVIREFTDKDTSTEIDHKANLAEEIKTYIDYNYKNLVTLDNLAKLFHIDKYYLSHLFKSQYGISVIAYYHSVRLEQAKSLLSQGFTVTETSDCLNYDSIYTFSRAFYNAYGIRPSFWKRKQNNG